MSVTDHPAWYYQQRDITDPTPYETDNRIFDGEECYLCGCEFYLGQKVIQIEPREHHYRFLSHEDCYNSLFRSIGERVRFEKIMDRLGFEIIEAEEEEG